MALQIRRGTESQRAGVMLAQGELVLTTDTQKLYVGDGATLGGVNVLQSTFVGGNSGLVWDTNTQTVKFDITAFSQLTTSSIPEGTRKYYTVARSVNDIYTALSQGSPSGISFTYNSNNNTIQATVTGGGGGSLPPLTGNNGKYLTIVNGALQWYTAPILNLSLPSQPGNQGSYLTTDGTNLVWADVSINALNSGSNYLQLDEANGNVTFYPQNGSGSLRLPQNGDIKRFNGSSYVSVLNGLINSVQQDTAPTLGGPLTLNGKNITGTGNINITGNVTATSLIGTTLGSPNSNIALGTNLLTTGYVLTGTGGWQAGPIITSSLSATLGANLIIGAYSITGTGGINISGTIQTGTGVSAATVTTGTITATTGLGADLPLNGFTIKGNGAINIGGNINTTASFATTNLSITGNSINQVNPATLDNVFRLNHTALWVYTDFGVDHNTGHTIVGTTIGASGTSSSINFNTARNTTANPQPVQTGDILHAIISNGYTGASHAQGTFIGSQVSGSFNSLSPSIPTTLFFSVGDGTNQLGAGTPIATLNNFGVFTAPVFKASSYATSSYPANPSAGMIIFDSTTYKFMGHNGTAWVAFTGP